MIKNSITGTGGRRSDGYVVDWERAERNLNEIVNRVRPRIDAMNARDAEIRAKSPDGLTARERRVQAVADLRVRQAQEAFTAGHIDQAVLDDAYTLRLAVRETPDYMSLVIRDKALWERVHKFLGHLGDVPCAEADAELRLRRTVWREDK